MPVNESGDRVEMAAVRRSVVLRVPVERVWAALTDGRQLSGWLGGDVDVDPFPGGQIAVREDGRVRRGVIVDLEPLRRLEIRWLPPSPRLGFLWGPDDAPPGSGGELEFRLEPAGDDRPAGSAPEPPRTRLTVIERAPTAAPVGRPTALAVA